VPDREKLSEIVFAETSTLGVRTYLVQRTALRRETTEVATPYGIVRVKLSYTPAGSSKAAPEYDDCKRLAVEKNVSLKAVYDAALQQIWQNMGPS
jgi:uncharacterized protein (DUF111 family)